MKAKNGMKKPRGKSAGKINSALLKNPKNDIKITNIKKINNINQIKKKFHQEEKMKEFYLTKTTKNFLQIILIIFFLNKKKIKDQNHII